MIRFTQRELDAILSEFLGKPYKRFASGPDAYDCYGLVKAFMARIGVDIPEIGAVNPNDSRPIYEQQQTDYVRIEWPRPWSLVTFSGKDLNAHIGVVLPNDNLFLHCPGRAAGKVLVEPLSRRPWRDTIDGYWWPKSVLESIIMLTPMTTKRAWQFVKWDGRSLGEIIEQDITDGRDVQVQAFIDGQLVEVDDWTMIPSPVNQLVVRPVVGEGDQMGMMAGMVALAMLAPHIAGPLAGVSSGAATAAGGYGAAAWAAGGSTAFAYGLANAAVMMGGALALKALIGPDEGKRDDSQHYTWEPQTTQRVGSFVPLVYGTFGVKGSIIAAYATGEHAVGESTWLKTIQIQSSTDLYHLKIAYSDGPIGGVVDGTEQLNGKAAEQYDDSDDFVIEHFVGNSDQAASSVLDGFEISVNKLCYDTAVSPNEVTKTFTAVKCDRAAAVLRFPNGFTNYTADGDSGTTSVDVTFRIRPSGGSWHTIFDGEIHGKTKNPVRLHLWFDGTYDGASDPFTKTSGTAFTLVAGTTYEVGVTRNNSRHSDRGDDFYFDCIQCSFTTAQKHPGLAYTAIGAAASKDISGAIDYYAQIKGKLVRVYDPDEEEWNIEWSDNPAWVAYDLLTRPVIKGNGDTEAYSVDYYRRLDPSYLVLADFVALADWCDELVPDESGESGSTEKRYVFNGVFDTEGTAWDQAVRVCRMACAMLHFRGHKIGVVIDKPGTPVQMFNVSNLRGGFSETWIDTREVATVYDCEFYDETGDYSAESWPVPLLGAANDVPAALDCFGHTKRSRVWRYASRQLRVNQYMKRFIEIPASLDAIYTDLGDIVYVQHPSLQRASGGRVVEVYADGVKLNKSVEMGEGDYALLIRTHDGTDERLTLYEVDSVTGVESGDNDIVVIDGTWEYTPNVNDLWTFGEEVKVIDLYRVKGFARGGDGQVLIQAAQYTTDYYTDDEEAPKIEAKTYSETKGGIAPSLLPTTAQAVAADRSDVDNAVDTLMWEGLSFTGDAINTVTWECTGDGVKYKGQWCPIEDDAVGTTDKYIYFDPAIGDPRYLQTTNDLSDLAGFERYVFCVNDGGVAYFKPGVLMTSDDVKLYNIEAGATVGATWGVNIADQPDGYLVKWQGTLTAHPADPEEGWAYRNSTDGKSYIYHDSAWYQMTADGVDGANGADGADGLSIVWRGESSSPPASPAMNHAYRDTDDGIIYIYNGTAWEPMVYDGSDGTDGAAGADGADGLSVFITYHDNAYDNPPSTPTGDGTTGGWHTNATSAVVWLSQKTAADASSGTWGTPFRVAGVDGADGADGAAGVDGTDGTSIVWQGTYASHPASPSNGWAYYNSTDGKSYVYQSGTWYQMTVDGVDGANGADGEDGLSIVWHGDATSPDPSWEVVNHCYRDTDNGYAYIYNGTAWELMVRDGSDGTAGTDGTDGLSVFVTYHDNAADTQPSDPTGDGTTSGWHTNVTSSVVWISQKVAADASSGTWGTPIRISGTAIWSEVIDDNGKPSNYADVTADNPVEAFRETFENPHNDVATRWLPDGTYDSGEVSTVAGGIVGGKVLQCGNNSDNDHVFRYFYRPIPFDPEKLYRIRARVRRVEGGGSFYLGVGGMDETKTTFVRYNGDNLDAGHHWVASQGAYPTDWTVYTGYVKGHADVGVNGNNSPHPDPSDPAKLHADVCYIHPVFQANNPYKTGIYEIDYIVIDTIPEEASWESVYGSGKPEDNADVTADNPVNSFRETFEDSKDIIATRWGISALSNRFEIVDEEGVAGGRILRCGDNDGNDYVRAIWCKKLPFDPTKLYRLRVRVRRTAGSGVFYLGLDGFLANGTTENNPSGHSSHWGLLGVGPGSDWTVYTVYFQGLDAVGRTGSGTVDSPYTLKEGTAYFSFECRANFNGETGITDIDQIILDVLPESADEIPEGGTNKWAAESGADVTAEHQGDINIDNIQDGSSYKKLSAANLAALQSAINLDTPQPRSGWEGAFTDDSPSAGYVAWSSFVVRYQGTDYTITASNADEKYLYWNAGATKTQLYATDTIGDALGSGKFIVGYNDDGTFYPSQFFKILHGALIQASTIITDHLVAKAITTEKLNDNAVTSPEAAMTTGSASAGTLQSVEITTTGGPVIVIGSATLTLPYSTNPANVFLKRDGTTIYDSSGHAKLINDGTPTEAVTMMIVDTPAADTYTYTLVATGGGSYTYRSLLALELKK
jgi:hypothetical protein